MKKALLTLLLALTLTASVVPLYTMRTFSTEVTNNLAWDWPAEEEGSAQEGSEDDHFITDELEIKSFDGAYILHGSRSNELKKAKHWEVSSPPPRM